jgi:ArsR family transcriptional regulator
MGNFGMEEVVKVFKALADITRIRIIVYLSLRPRYVCELADLIGCSQPTISRHLQILCEAKIVSCERDGSYVIYSLSPKDEFVKDLLEILMGELKKSNFYRELLIDEDGLKRV